VALSNPHPSLLRGRQLFEYLLAPMLPQQVQVSLRQELAVAARIG
jgi:hypothetical protein